MPKTQLDRIIDQGYVSVRPRRGTTAPPTERPGPLRLDRGWRLDAGYSLDGPNSVANPSFEVNTTGWTNYSTGAPVGTRTRVNTQARDGSWSYQFVKTGGPAADRLGATTTFAAVAGKHYRCAVWFNVTAIAGTSQNCRFQISGNGGAAGALISLTISTVGVTDGWQQMTLDFDCLTNATFTLYTFITNPDTATLYVDAVHVGSNYE